MPLVLLVALATGCIAALLCTPWVITGCYAVGLLDRPSPRRVHALSTPRGGGLAVIPAMSVAAGTGVVAGWVLELPWPAEISKLSSSIAVGTYGMLLVGLYDDVRSARPWLKLALQSSIAVATWNAGLRFDTLIGAPMGVLSLPLTVLWVLAVINAINLIDGLDGLASGISVIALGVFCAVACLHARLFEALLSAATAGALLGFLAFNRHPARIFLGDCGSMPIGFLLAVLSLRVHEGHDKGTAALGISVLALGLPWIDLLFAFGRRILQGRSPFEPDAEHIHHRVLRRTGSQTDAVRTLYRTAGLLAVGALSLLHDGLAGRLVLLATLGAAAIVLARHMPGRVTDAKPSLEIDMSGPRSRIEHPVVHEAIFSIDVEDWFHILDVSSTPRLDQWNTLPSRVEGNFRALLAQMERHGVKATCFFLGWIAERYPHLVREAADAGHEIASHGFAHSLVETQGRLGFRADIRKAKALLEQVSGRPVDGYRCPGFSVTQHTPWFFEEVAAAGYRYDSSVFPAPHGHGDTLSTQLRPHRVETASGSILEFPITVEKVWGRPICCFGGGYLRLSPYPLIAALGRRVVEQRRPLLFYIHPRDIDDGQPRLPMPPARRFKSYVNLGGTHRKLDKIMANFRFSTFRDYLESDEGVTAP